MKTATCVDVVTVDVVTVDVVTVDVTGCIVWRWGLGISFQAHLCPTL